MVAIIRPHSLELLEAALARAVDADPGLEHARALVLHPLRLLDAIAVDVDAVLQHDEQGAIQRIGLLLGNAVGVAPQLGHDDDHHDHHSPGELTELIHAVEGKGFPAAALDGKAALLREDPDIKLCPGGLLDLGALVLVGLAAARVGSRSQVGRPFVSAVFNLALSAMPAEALAEALADGLSDDQLAAMLAGACCVGEAAGGVVSRLFDLCGRARFEAIAAIMARLLGDVAGPWDTTSCESIHRIERSPHAANQLKLVLRVAADDINTATNELIAELLEGKATLVFRSGDGTAVEVERRKLRRAEPEHDMLYVEPPPGVMLGWLGIATRESKRRVHEQRKALRKKWRALSKEPFLAATPVDLDCIPLWGPETALLPPRSPAAMWSMITAVRTRQRQSNELRPHVDTLVEVDYHAPGTVELRVQVGERETSHVLTARDGQARGVIPGAELDGSTTITVTLHVTGHADHVVEVPLELSGTELKVLLWRPAFVVNGRIDRVSEQQAERLFDGARSHAGVGIDRVELPWISTDELVMSGDPRSSTSFQREALLGELEALAARSEGLEDTLIVALIPGLEAVSALQPAEAARAVAYATRGALGELLRLARATLAPSRPAKPRLRLVGHIGGEGVSLSEPTRVTTRAAGPGAPHPSKLVAALFDAHGVEIGGGKQRVPIHTQRANGTGRFVALLELPEHAWRIELFHEGEYAQPIPTKKRTISPIEAKAALATRAAHVLSRKLRVPLTPALPRPGTPRRVAVLTRHQPAHQLALVNDDPKHLGWSYVDNFGLPATLEIELGRAGVWTRVQLLHSPSSSTSLDLDERCSDAPTHLRLVASDGWNVLIETIELPQLGPAKPALIRRVGESLFVDADPEVIGRELEFVSAATAGFSRLRRIDEMLTLSKFDPKDIVLGLPSKR